MYSSEDLERFYFQYQTESLPHGESLQSFCVKNKVPYNRMFSFDNRSYSLFEKKFVAGYQFMKVERNGADTVYRIDWKDVVLILENSIVKTLKIR